MEVDIVSHLHLWLKRHCQDDVILRIQDRFRGRSIVLDCGTAWLENTSQTDQINPVPSDQVHEWALTSGQQFVDERLRRTFCMSEKACDESKNSWNGSVVVKAQARARIQETDIRS